MSLLRRIRRNSRTGGGGNNDYDHNGNDDTNSGDDFHHNSSGDIRVSADVDGEDDEEEIMLDMTTTIATDTSGENTAAKTPVGVTIAFLRHHQQVEQQQHHQEGSPSEFRLISPTGKQRQTIKATKKKKSPSARTTLRRRGSRGGGGRPRRSSRRRKSGAGGIRTKKSVAYKKPVSSFRVLLEGAFLYFSCLILPSLIGYLYQNYYEWRSILANTSPEMIYEAFMGRIYNSTSSIAASSTSNETTTTTSTAFLTNDKEMDPVTAVTYSYGYWAYEKAAEKLCPLNVSPNSYYYSYTTWLCPSGTNGGQGTLSPAESIYSPDITQTWKQDAVVVAVTAVVLALIRFALVKAFAPTSLKDKTSIHAMVRCKSIHLLSSDYHSTLTPSNSRKVLSTLMLQEEKDGVVVGGAETAPPPSLPPFFPPPIPSFSDEHSSSHLGLRLDEDDHDAGERGPDPFLPKTTTSTPAAAPPSAMNPPDERQNAGDDGQCDEVLIQGYYEGEGEDEDDVESIGDDADDEHDLCEYDNEADDESSAEDDEGGEEEHLDDDDVDEEDTPGLPPVQTASSNMAEMSSGSSSFSRLYAAPRFATAVFRLLFTTTASGLALYWFSDSSFWPWYLGGKGSTSKAWDLNGLAVTFDSDFDHHNSVLKFYFLWQASYHLHAWAFDVLLATLTLIKRGCPSSPTASASLLSPGFGASTASLQTATLSCTGVTTRGAYLGSLLQHLVALVLIAVAYVFSSLRRLAAIAMFSFDISSSFLHLLQMCLNAQDPSLKNKKVVSAVYYGGVLPSFILMRFGVWPALWYSATFESQNWFRQLESVLVPRAALVVQLILQCWILLCLVLTVVYFRRLRRQPHLQRILNSED